MSNTPKDIDAQLLAMSMLAQGDLPDKGRDLLRRLQDDLPIILEHIKISAEMTRAKYLALKEQGFTDREALELSKTVP